MTGDTTAMIGKIFRRQERNAYTLVELLISMGAATLVMGGLCGTLFISSKALTPDAPAAADANQSALALSQLASDVRHAQSFSERTANAVTFTVPDRDGDLLAETIRYSWSGTPGHPLQYAYNNGTPASVIANVQDFKLSAITRLISDAAIEDPGNLVIYESFAEAKAAGLVNILALPAPSGVQPGNLLIAAMAIDGGGGATLVAPVGWNLLARLDGGGQVGMAVWWKVATATEPNNYTIIWVGLKKAYGWTMRFSGNHATSPINAFSSSTGSSASATCPAVTTTVENAMILRLGGFDDDDITVDSAGIAGYTTITMDKSDASTTSASGGAAHATLGAIGSSGTANFALTASEEYVTFSVALAPDN
jgi:hypothetical protein